MIEATKTSYFHLQPRCPHLGMARHSSMQVLTDLQQSINEEVTGFALGTLMELCPQIALLRDT